MMLKYVIYLEKISIKKKLFVVEQMIQPGINCLTLFHVRGWEKLDENLFKNF